MIALFTGVEFSHNTPFVFFGQVIRKERHRQNYFTWLGFLGEKEWDTLSSLGFPSVIPIVSKKSLDAGEVLVPLNSVVGFKLHGD